MLSGAIGPILVVSGVATLVAGLAAMLFPKPLLRLGFGVAAVDGALLFFVRHWGLLIACVGALIAWSASGPAGRTQILTAGAVEKLAIGALVFFGPLKRTPLMTAIALGDGLFAILYIAYLIAP